MKTSHTVLLCALGGAGVLAWLAYRNAKPAVAEDCKNRKVWLEGLISSSLVAEDSCLFRGDKQACDSWKVLGSQIENMQKAWPPACGFAPNVPKKPYACSEAESKYRWSVVAQNDAFEKCLASKNTAPECAKRQELTQRSADSYAALKVAILDGCVG